MQDDMLGGVGLDWYDYGARMYDPTIGRWHVIDPLLEKYISLSPYHTCRNNPISFVDFNGMNNGLADLVASNAEKFGHTSSSSTYSYLAEDGSSIGIYHKYDTYHGDYVGLNNDVKAFSVDEGGNVNPLNNNNQIVSNHVLISSENPENVIQLSNIKILPQLANGKKRDWPDAEGYIIETTYERHAITDEESADDMIKTFLFLADNTEVEWVINYAKVDGKVKYGLGTYGLDDLSPSTFLSKYIITSVHSHPDPVGIQAEEGSMYGDRGNSTVRNYNMYVYMKNSSNLYHVKNGKSTLKVKINGDYKRFINLK